MPSNGKSQSIRDPIEFVPKNVKYLLSIGVIKDSYSGNYEVVMKAQDRKKPDFTRDISFLPVSHDFYPNLDDKEVWELLRNTVFYRVHFLPPDDATKSELTKKEVIDRIRFTLHIICEIIGCLHIENADASMPYYSTSSEEKLEFRIEIVYSYFNLIKAVNDF